MPPTGLGFYPQPRINGGSLQRANRGHSAVRIMIVHVSAIGGAGPMATRTNLNGERAIMAVQEQIQASKLWPSSERAEQARSDSRMRQPVRTLANKDSKMITMLVTYAGDARTPFERDYWIDAHFQLVRESW